MHSEASIDSLKTKETSFKQNLNTHHVDELYHNSHLIRLVNHLLYKTTPGSARHY